MTKITGTLATLLLLPLLAFGANSVADAGAQAPASPAPSQLTSQNPYECCWIWHGGIWYCVPCG